MMTNNIKKIESLILEMNGLDFTKKVELDAFLSKIQNVIVSIFGEEHHYAINLVKDAKARFTPQFSTSLKEYRSAEKESLDVGKKDLNASLESVLAFLNSHKSKESNSNFIDNSIIDRLRQKVTTNFDTQKLIKYLEEINYNYQAENFLTCAILTRAVLNYIPPIFSQTNFRNVVSNHSTNPYTRKNDNFDTLEQGMRKIGDLHNHDMIKKTESIPTKNQIEPYKPQFEYLLNEIIAKVN